MSQNIKTTCLICFRSFVCRLNSAYPPRHICMVCLVCNIVKGAGKCQIDVHMNGRTQGFQAEHCTEHYTPSTDLSFYNASWCHHFPSWMAHMYMAIYMIYKKAGLIRPADLTPLLQSRLPTHHCCWLRGPHKPCRFRNILTQPNSCLLLLHWTRWLQKLIVCLPSNLPRPWHKLALVLRCSLLFASPLSVRVVLACQCIYKSIKEEYSMNDTKRKDTWSLLGKQHWKVWANWLSSSSILNRPHAMVAINNDVKSLWREVQISLVISLRTNTIPSVWCAPCIPTDK